MKYKTIKKKIEFEGIGIHSGKNSKVIIEKAEKSSGINFYINGSKIPSDLNYVVNTKRATVLGKEKFKISTVEHLLSAIYGLCITDITINVLGEEIPAYDGSAKFFVELFLDSGLTEIKKIKKFNVKKEFKFEFDNSKYEILPSDILEIECEIYSKESVFLDGQKFCLKFNTENYIKEISFAKTYCLLKDIEKIQSSGYGLGGNLENVIIIDNDKVINSEKLTYKDECVRHKILDFIGDFSLLNKYINAKIKIVNPNHYCNFEFCKKIRDFLN
ncbi:MAG: UDP-3-O-acyl-N-acetylglucosamine deacetylase [Endomicrobiia bacterium]